MTRKNNGLGVVIASRWATIRNLARFALGAGACTIVEVEATTQLKEASRLGGIDLIVFDVEGMNGYELSPGG
jgi:hypothetical protein